MRLSRGARAVIFRIGRISKPCDVEMGSFREIIVKSVIIVNVIHKISSVEIYLVRGRITR